MDPRRTIRRRLVTAVITAASAFTLLAVSAAPGFAKDRCKVKGELENSGADDNANGSLSLSVEQKGGKFDLKLRNLDPSTAFAMQVDGVPEAEFESDSRGGAKLRFRTAPSSSRFLPLDFDPRGKTISINDGTGNVLAAVASGAGEPAGMSTAERVFLTPTAGTAGTALARFRARKDGRQDFSVELSAVAETNYTLFVDGIERGTINVSAGLGEIEFKSPPTDDPNLLDFDPRGKNVDVVGAAGLAFSGPLLASGAGVTTCAFSETRVAIASTGLDPDGSSDAKLRIKENCKKSFDVEIEDVPVGAYDVYIDGALKGVLTVTDDGFKIEGELEFSSGSDDEGELPLDFNPEGALIEVKQGASTFLSGFFVGGTTSATSSGTCTPSEEELPLLNAGVVPAGSGDAKFRVRDDCENKFDVEIEDVPLGDYDVYVEGVLKGALTVVFDGEQNKGEIGFSSGGDDLDELPLDFDPHGKLIEVKQGATILFSRTFEGGATGGPSTCDAAEIREDLLPTGPGAGSDGEARYRVDADCRADFRVQAEDLPVGDYNLIVGGVNRGTVTVANVSGVIAGEIEFDTDPTEPGKVLLVFDPRSQLIELERGGSIYMNLAFPSN